LSDRIQRPLVDAAISEQEERRLHAQRLEAIGRLAGGVAHDFNNLLTAIIGYSDLLLRRLNLESEREMVEEILRAGKRASELTHQLLIFSRRQVLKPVVLDLNAVVRGLGGILQRLIGEDVELLTLTNAERGNVLADPGQMEQVILNLAANARDAMPRGGRLTIETANVRLDEEYASRHVSVHPGDYVMLAVTDTGDGMDEETREKIFEPFFTTKLRGKGTGLGLSTVYGIVKQSGGNIWVYSEHGRGTTFKLYFPQTGEPLTSMPNQPRPLNALRKDFTVLLVEDDPGVRGMTERMLKLDGCRVLVADGGPAALEFCKTYEGEIDLLLTDVVMPGLSGTELARQCAEHGRVMPVLYMSGYTDEAVVRHGILERDVEFIQKPFGPDTLMRKVRKVLSQRR
jgi:nitrogen-specific signal transduction histidine kinase/ActR/RegA family two-component response regulator